MKQKPKKTIRKVDYLCSNCGDFTVIHETPINNKHCTWCYREVEIVKEEPVELFYQGASKGNACTGDLFETDEFKITKVDGNWVIGTYKGKGGDGDYYVEAKIYSVGSCYGISNGRVSKMTICTGDKWNPNKVVYHYDRGKDIDAPIGREFAKMIDKTRKFEKVEEEK